MMLLIMLCCWSDGRIKLGGKLRILGDLGGEPMAMGGLKMGIRVRYVKLDSFLILQVEDRIIMKITKMLNRVLLLE